MSIWSNIRNVFRRNKTIAQVQLMQQTGTSFVSWRGNVYNSDIVRACIRPKVKAVGKLVAKHIRDTIMEDGSHQIVTNPSFNMRMLLEEPNPLMTGQLLQEKIAAQLCLNNNAFVLIGRNPDGVPVALYPIVPVSAEYQTDNTGTIMIRFVLQNGRVYTFAYSDIIHLRQDFNENDIFGTPLAPALTPLLDVVTITDQGVKSAIKNSSIIRWLLKFSNSMRPDDLKKQAKDFADNFLANSEGVGVAATDAKADAQQIQPTDYVPNAAQMDRTTQRIYALFNTSPAIVTGTASEDQRNAYFDAEVEPVERQLSDEYTRKLFTRRERGFGNKIAFEADAWDNASTSTKLNLVQMVDRGAMSINEWRRAFNLAPTPGGDVFVRRLDTEVVNNNNVEKQNEAEGKNDGND